VHGRRLLVTCRTAQGRRLKVVLQPIDVHEGIWRLRTVLLPAQPGDNELGVGAIARLGVHRMRVTT
jgi:hypothetical protein